MPFQKSGGTNLEGINRKSKHLVQYPDVPSAIRQISDDQYFPVPEPDGDKKYSSDSEHCDMIVVAGDDAYKPEEDDQPISLT